MIFMYLFAVLTLIGFSCWIFGAIVHKRATLLDKKNRKKQQQRAELFGAIAKISFIVAALFFVTGIMMLYGVKMTQQ